MTDLEKQSSKYAEQEKEPGAFFGVRHIQFVLLFCAALIAYGMRTNMSVGIIAMMDENPPDPSIPTFPKWTQKETILSAFFWGYVIPQIVAGQLVKKYGSKYYLGVTMCINCLFTLLIPIMAVQVGETGVIVCRIIQGLTQGFLFPSIHTLLSKWAPSSEKSKIGSFVYSGGPLGTAISLPVTGLIADSSAGWPTAFYLYGALGLAWSVMWFFLGADSPDKHKSISDEERKYIEKGLSQGHAQKEIPTPWLKILTSMPFWAVLASHIGHSWGFWTLLTEIPSYMSKIMKYELSENSLLSALPYFVLFILNFGFGAIADFLITRQYLSTTAVRKLMNAIGTYCPAAALIALGYVSPSEKGLALTLLVITVGINSAVYSGFNVNHIDIAPNHAGPLMGITNSVSNIFSILAPLIIDIVGREETDPILWRIVFGVAAGVYIVTTTFFIIFASGEIQDWNEDLVGEGNISTIGKTYADKNDNDKY